MLLNKFFPITRLFKYEHIKLTGDSSSSFDEKMATIFDLNFAECLTNLQLLQTSMCHVKSSSNFAAAVGKCCHEKEVHNS